MINTTHGVSVTDNPEKYEGFDARDDICIPEGPSIGTCLSNFRFFVISKAPFETAIQDEGFDGYLGLFPHISHETGLFDKTKPSYVTALHENGLISEPIVAINIVKVDNPNLQVIFGGYNASIVLNETIFKSPVSLI